LASLFHSFITLLVVILNSAINANSFFFPINYGGTPLLVVTSQLTRGVEQRHTSSSKSSSSSTLAVLTMTKDDYNFRDGQLRVSQHNGLYHLISYWILNPMSLSSRVYTPLVILHSGSSVPSNYLYPLVEVLPSSRCHLMVFHDQLGCGSSDEPTAISLYLIKDFIKDLRALLNHLGVRNFHLYGQSYG
jgi:pimeloyl-ACP methyl ester carboxylesterase